MKKKVTIISIISILVIIGIISAIIFLNPKSSLDNKDSNHNQNQVIDDRKNDDEQNNIVEDNNTIVDNKQEEKQEVKDDTQTSTKSNTKKNNSSNTNSNNISNNQPSQPTSTPEQPKETTPVVTETKYYAQCSLGSLESGKQLTESQIKAKYPVGESSTLGQGTLHSDLDKIAPQTGLSRDAFDAYQGACKWISTDNKKALGYTMIVHIAITNNFEKWKDINIDLYNNYKNAYNNLAYKNWDSSHRIIGEYYLNNHQWKWNPNNLHF